MSSNNFLNNYFDTVINSKGSYIPQHTKNEIIESLSGLDESMIENPVFSEMMGSMGRKYFFQGDLNSCDRGGAIIKAAASFAENKADEDVELLYGALKCSFDDSFASRGTFEEQNAILDSLNIIYKAADASGSDSPRRFADRFIDVVNNIHNVAVKENKNVSGLHEYLSGFITYLSTEEPYKNIIASPNLWTAVARNTKGSSEDLRAGFGELYEFFNLNMGKNCGLPASPELADSFDTYKGLIATLKRMWNRGNEMTGLLPEKYSLKSSFDCGHEDKIVIVNGNVAYICQDARNNIALVPTKENLMLMTDKALNDPVLAGKLVSEDGEEYILLGQLSSEVRANIVDRQLLMLLDTISDRGFEPIEVAISLRNDSGDVLSEKMIRKWSKNNTIKRRPTGSDELALVSKDGVVFLGNQYLMWGHADISAPKAPRRLALNPDIEHQIFPQNRA